MGESTALLGSDQLALLSAADQYEFVNGRPVEKHMGAKSDRVSLRIGGLLDAFCLRHKAGIAFGSSTGYKCFPNDPTLVRKPDASVIGPGRLPNDDPPDGNILIAPDLAVEAISPNELYEEVEAKVNEYLGAGVRLVWVVSPGSRTVLVRRPGGSAAVLTESGELSGEDVVPGFACPVADLFA